MITMNHIIAAFVLPVMLTGACSKGETGNDSPAPVPIPEKEEKAPAFRFYVDDLEFIPGQSADIAFMHKDVTILSSSIPTGWSVVFDESDNTITIKAPDASREGFSCGGSIQFKGNWNNNELVSNELNVSLLGINKQQDWDRFCAGKTDGYLVDGVIYLNCDVTAAQSIAVLTAPLDGHGHTITLDIPAEKSCGGLFGTLQKNVKDLNLKGRVTAAARNDGDGCASLAMACSEGVRIENVCSSAEVVLDFQTRHLSSNALSGLVAKGGAVMENCSFTGSLKALNCDCGQDLTSLEGVDVDIPTGCFSLRQLKITSDEIGNSYILQTEGGKVIVFDGGNTDQADNLLANINAHYGGKVDEWWLSHPHGDHVGAFCKIIGTEGHIPVGKVVHSDPPANIVSAESGSVSSLRKSLAAYQNEGGTVVDLRKAGERYEIDGVFIKVLGIATEDFPQRGSPYPSPINNASVIIRVWDREKSVIFLGDAQELKGEQVLQQFGAYMHCDYLQMGHHGNWTCGKSFYDAVEFKAALWPTPTFLWTCQSGNKSGWDNWKYREWVAAKGVKENHVSCLGDWLLEMETNK